MLGFRTANSLERQWETGMLEADRQALIASVSLQWTESEEAAV